MKTLIIKYLNVKSAFIQLCLVFTLIIGMQSCNNYLDVVPDNTPNWDHVFGTKKETERYLATLYSYIPEVTIVNNLHFLGGDDLWTYRDYNYDSNLAWRIALGEQNASAPLVNYWDGSWQIPKTPWDGIRNCNIFISEMSKSDRLPDLSMAIRKRWIAEAKCLKAYYHFVLLRMYGPIPIADKNIPVESGLEHIQVERKTVDEVASYISNLYIESAKDLPERIDNLQIEAGRLTRGAALALNAKHLVMVASPLFNGNKDYNQFIDHKGNHLINQAFSEEKWKAAADACKQALEALDYLSLHRFVEGYMSEGMRKQLSQSGSVWNRFNEETIWTVNMTESSSMEIQRAGMPPHIDPRIEKSTYLSSYVSVTLGMAERYYTKNGVPIFEDKNWSYADRFKLITTDESHKNLLQQNFVTARFNLDRELRYYGNLAFDGSLVFLKGVPAGSEDNSYKVRAKFGEPNGYERIDYSTVTGIWAKKLTSWEFSPNDQGATTQFYPWPAMRLADLFLLSAEAYNEIGNSGAAIYYLDKIRERVGLKGVEESWTQYSTNPNKYKHKEGLREIIHQEREIELAFEVERLWDLKRWKKSADFLNKNIQGWNVKGKTTAEFYQPTVVFQQSFLAPRDYFWPLSIDELRRNPRLIQNPGW